MLPELLLQKYCELFQRSGGRANYGMEERNLRKLDVKSLKLGRFPRQTRVLRREGGKTL